MFLHVQKMIKCLHRFNIEDPQMFYDKQIDKSAIALHYSVAMPIPNHSTGLALIQALHQQIARNHISQSSFLCLME